MQIYHMEKVWSIDKKIVAWKMIFAGYHLGLIFITKNIFGEQI